MDFPLQKKQMLMEDRLQVLDLEPPVTNHENEILAGLSKQSKMLPPKFFYDQKGSELFDAITELDEYYLTRTEKKILTDHQSDIAKTISQEKIIIEPGSGSSEKIQLLLNKLKPDFYIPMEISTDYMLKVARDLQMDFPDLELLCIKADYTYEMPSVEQLPEGEKVAFFPGSTIGNFSPEKARTFLQSVRNMVGDDGALLLGVDLKKNVAIIEAAYNDSKGVTADFNLNILSNINALTGSNFELKNWTHQAIYDEQKGCINMYLVSNCEQHVTIADHNITFLKNEKIHTENCYKFSLEDCQTLCDEAGFNVNKVWTDDEQLFAVVYATV